MGLTLSAGVPSTRSGDLDPGLIGCLARTGRMDAKQFDEMSILSPVCLGSPKSVPTCATC